MHLFHNILSNHEVQRGKNQFDLYIYSKRHLKGFFMDFTVMSDSIDEISHAYELANHKCDLSTYSKLNIGAGP